MKKIHCLFQRRATKTALGLCLLLIGSLSICGNPAAEIRFQEVGSRTGITHRGATFGAAWGDFNGDGWPDLWVGNHNRKPSLYLNRTDGTFENIIDAVWDADPKLDTHGAAWADFDNDGDQDLIELADSSENPDGTFCIGCGKNNFFVNQGGRLLQRSAETGLDQIGQGRSPQWFDANRDGLLDVLVVNTRAADQPASAVFLQDKTHRFARADAQVGFKDAPWDKTERIVGRLENLLKLTNRKLPQFAAQTHLEFASLADFSGDGRSDLAFFSNPTRVYRTDTIPFEDISNDIGLPDRTRIKDAAIADFDGDGKLDIFVVEGSWLPAHVLQDSADTLKGMITWSGGREPKAVRFQTRGEVDFQIHPTWLAMSKIFIGAKGIHPDSRSFRLAPDDPRSAGSFVPEAGPLDGVTIGHDPGTGTYTILNAQKSVFVDFIVSSTQAISQVETVNFTPYQVEGQGILYLKHDGRFIAQQLQGKAGDPAAGISVAAGDFDNDMDMDIYVVCTGPIMNLPNLLLENDGKANFRAVPDAGGAEGSPVGRGDVVAVADYDQDGFLDLFLTNGADPTSPFVADGPHQLFRNQGNGHHWLEVDLQGTVGNRDGIGSRVTLEAGGITQVREQTGGMHRITQNHSRLHFGLGGHAKIDQVTVTWPGGIVQRVREVQADQILRIVEPADKTNHKG